MEKLQWKKFLWSGIMHFLFCLSASIAATDPVNEINPYLNISEPYLNMKINDTIFIKCSGSTPLSWHYESPLRTKLEGYYEQNIIDNAYGNESIIQLTFKYEKATGRYSCGNNYANASVYIYVNGNRLILYNLAMLLFVGELNYIECFPSISEINMTLWKVKGEKKEAVSLEFDPTKGFLIHNLTDYFSGRFECYAEYDGRNQTAKFEVDIPEPTTTIPLVYIDKSNAQYVMSGSDFSLICIVQTDVYAEVEIQWVYPAKLTKPGKVVLIEPDHQNYNYVNHTKTLTILNASEIDTGSYRCIAEDYSNRRNFAETSITVYATHPETTLTFYSDMEEIIKSRNENIELVASYEVFPPVSDIRVIWSKDEEPIVSNFKHIVQHSNSYFSLKISGLTKNDSGMYTVTANVAGNFSKKSFLLWVKDTPVLKIKANPSCCYNPVRKYNLTCEIKGYPLPNITWSWRPFCFHDTPQCNLSNESNTWKTFEEYYKVNNSTVRTVDNGRSIISTLSVIAKESGFYKCNAENEFGAAEEEKMFVVSDADKGFEIISQNNPIENSRFSAICKASLVLYTDLQWKWTSEVSNQSMRISTAKPVFSKTDLSLQMEVKNIAKNESGTYICVAISRKNGNAVEKSVIVNVQGISEALIQEYGLNRNLFITLIILGLFLSLIVIACIIKVVVNKKKKKGDFRDFSPHFLEGKMAFFDNNLPLDEQVDLLPYDETWEFPRERLKLGKTLGQGAFGRVIKAEAFEISEDGISTTVAVKMLKERADINQQKSLMDELKILIHLGHHVNIVNLMGAVTRNIPRDGLMVIVEYCRHGNIRHYLQRHRDSFMNEINPQNGKITPSGDIYFTDDDSIHDFNSELVHNSSSSSSGVFSVHNPNYRRTRERNAICSNPRGSDNQYSGSFSTSSGSVFRSYSRSDSQESVITTSDLLCYTFQCARGMDYLASKKLIHRDLAARNILLADDKIVKICDFGLAKDCYKYENYIKKGDGPLPIKWMSIESIWDHIFTTKSDVWSFGILMWELFTLGGNPYPGLDINEHFYKKLKAGYRMEKPDLCPGFAYQIMRDCWNADPDKRPHFSHISEMIGNYLEENIKQHYIDVNEPYMEMNRKMRSPHYSNVEGQEFEESVPYVNSKVEDTASSYDIPRVCHSILNEPMEVVPMIQFESNPDTLCNPSSIEKKDTTA